MADKTLYNEQSIESLSPLEFTRLRPGVYAGNTTYSTQLLVEIVSNAVDEWRLGHGGRILVKIIGDRVIVQDFGQGFIPNSFRDDGKTILEAAFSVLNTSGKYREDGTYEGTSLGSFGIGSKITTFLSHWLKVETHRDGQYEIIYFKEGVFDKRENGKLSVVNTGTTVEWQPSEEFFTNTTVEIAKVKDLFRTITCLCKGLTIELDNNGEVTTYYSENGLNDLADAFVKDSEVINNRFSMNYVDGKHKLDLILTYTSNYSLTLVPYVNTGLTEKGPHIAQVKAIITREFNKFFRDKKWLKDKDENLTGDDIQEGMYIVFNITTANVSYDAQVKSTVTKLDMSPFATIIAENIQAWLSSNEKEVKIIAEKALNARKAREAARKAREAARNKVEKKEKALKFDSKLADASEKKERHKCEIYITEGDSASGMLKDARNKQYQAVMPIRGKMLNVQDASIDKILANAEIVTIMDAFFGPNGWRVVDKKIEYDMDKLRYGKIIIMSDADVDGAHIKNLFYTFVWNVCPELLKQGYIYAGRAPLYKITEKNGKSYVYLRDDAELEKYRAAHKGEKYDVGRMKGLGEMGVEETEECLTDMDKRVIDQITVKDEKAANDIFMQMMGSNVAFRKQFLKQYGKEAMYNAE
jgi:DNA gyrase subunit B